MSLGVKNRLAPGATMVANAFIDEWMAAANGEYVKVYLYLLRHGEEEIEVGAIADALNHTEADVRRALAYWEKCGVLGTEAPLGARGREEMSDGAEAVPSQAESRKAEVLRFPAGEHGAKSREETASSQDPANEAGYPSVEKRADSGRAEAVSERDGRAEAAADEYGQAALLAVPEEDSRTAGERMERLSGDEEFSALLYAVQQYLGKTFTPIECEKFAFFYDGLHMSGELLEYLAEYCAGGGHTSIRYIEKVAINWYQRGIRTREDAKDYTIRFSKDTSAVMKAFGITNRNPATAEQEFMRRWFREFGFDSAIVTEACSRTIKATGAASFPYADKILTGWKENGVRVLGDVEELDRRRQAKKAQDQTAGRTQSRPQKGGNRFKNFDERSYDYENYIWESMRKKGGPGDGTQ